MATTTDPRAAAFKIDEFRDAIRFAMNMGIPDKESERLTWKWTTDKTYSGADVVGKPYLWNEAPDTTEEHDDVQIPVAVEFIARTTGGVSNTPWGEIENPRLQVTILDEDYEKVVGSDVIEVDGSIYYIKFVSPPQGLFAGTIYTVHAIAEDEK